MNANLKTVLTKWKLEGFHWKEKVLYKTKLNDKPYEVGFLEKENWAGETKIIYRKYNGNYSLVYADITHVHYGNKADPDELFIKNADIRALMNYT